MSNEWRAPNGAAPQPPRLLDQLRDRIRLSVTRNQQPRAKSAGYVLQRVRRNSKLDGATNATDSTGLIVCRCRAALCIRRSIALFAHREVSRNTERSVEQERAGTPR